MTATISDLLVRPIAATDHAEWLDMWDAYCAFYNVRLPSRVTQRTWQRLCAGDVSMQGLIAVSASTGAALGFANYVVHPFTWSEGPACYLEDLFVRLAARGAGIGRALIERLTALGAERGWARLYWHTQASNVIARRLYDRFGAADDFVRYVLPLEELPGT